MSTTRGGIGELRQGLLHDGAVDPIGDQRLGTAVLEDEGDGCRIEAGVEGIEHRAGHRDAVVGLQKGR